MKEAARGSEDALRVGELAKRVGLTVRTLHHWDHLGLLSPSRRTPAGHRLYTPQDLEKLQKVLSLRSLGLSLEEVGDLLGREAPSLAMILRSHRDRIRKQAGMLQELGERLDELLKQLAAGRVVTTDDLIRTMEMTTMIDKHFTPEQLETLKKREAALGPEAIQEAQEEWPRLIARVREEMEKGTSSTSDEVLELARRWQALIHAFSGGDPGIEASLGKMYQSEPDMAASQGLDPALFGYIGEALRRIREES